MTLRAGRRGRSVGEAGLADEDAVALGAGRDLGEAQVGALSPLDRLIHGAVMDFVLFHVTTASWSFNWYVFNLADVAIVAGVVGLLYESLFVQDAAKAP